MNRNIAQILYGLRNTKAAILCCQNQIWCKFKVITLGIIKVRERRNSFSTATPRKWGKRTQVCQAYGLTKTSALSELKALAQLMCRLIFPGLGGWERIFRAHLK